MEQGEKQIRISNNTMQLDYSSLAPSCSAYGFFHFFTLPYSFLPFVQYQECHPSFNIKWTSQRPHDYLVKNQITDLKSSQFNVFLLQYFILCKTVKYWYDDDDDDDDDDDSCHFLNSYGVQELWCFT